MIISLSVPTTHQMVKRSLYIDSHSAKYMQYYSLASNIFHMCINKKRSYQRTLSAFPMAEYENIILK